MFSHDDFQKATNVSRETLQMFFAYEELLKKWQAKINLISPTTLDDIWHRHFYDSAQLVPYIENFSTAHIVDLGSGAGFPGLVLAALGAGRVELVESDQRKAIFLNEVKRTLNLSNVVVHNKRIEGFTPEKTPNYITARALAGLGDLFEHVEKIGVFGETKALFLKGERFQDELTKAAKAWHSQSIVYPSLTHPASAVLIFSEVARV